MKTRVAIGVLALALLGGFVLGQEVPPQGRGRGGGGGGGGGRGGAAAGAPGAAPATAPAGRGGEARSDSSVTHGSIKTADGKTTDYTAVAGYMPLTDEQDRPRANIFYIAYTSDAGATGTAETQPSEGTHRTIGPVAAGSTRPITFVFNGGPGAASVWLHLGAVGPRRIDVPEDGSPPVAPYRTVDNEYTWLTASDLVFIDPVNTGYSRAATPEQAREFLGVQEDISAMGEFIRLYLTKNQRWGSKVFLAGESYGTTRAAALSNYLQDRVGVSVTGVTLISTVLNFATLSPSEANDLPYALYLPSYAAVASYHKKVQMPKGFDQLLKDAESFAMGDYMTALNKGESISEDERQRVANRMSELIGLSPDYIQLSNLRVAPGRFEKELLRGKDGETKVIGRYDGRLAGYSPDGTGAGQDYDPSFSNFYTAYTSAFNVYVRNTLKYDNDLPYEVLSGRVQPWNYASGGAGGTNGYLYVGDDLRDAMTRNPHMRLLVCSGHYDLATPYFATDYTLNHMTMPPEIRKNISQAYFPGGHMIYHVREGLQKLFKEQTEFIEK